MKVILKHKSLHYDDKQSWYGGEIFHNKEPFCDITLLFHICDGGDGEIADVLVVETDNKGNLVLNENKQPHIIFNLGACYTSEIPSIHYNKEKCVFEIISDGELTLDSELN